MIVSEEMGDGCGGEDGRGAHKLGAVVSRRVRTNRLGLGDANGVKSSRTKRSAVDRVTKMLDRVGSRWCRSGQTLYVRLL